MAMKLDHACQDVLEKASQIVERSKYVVALVGAGMSAESGIPTYRGPGGLWTRIGEPDPRSYQAFLADPKGWWERSLGRAPSQEQPERHQFREAIERAKPNPGHHAPVELEQMGVSRLFLPGTTMDEIARYIEGAASRRKLGRSA